MIPDMAQRTFLRRAAAGAGAALLAACGVPAQEAAPPTEAPPAPPASPSAQATIEVWYFDDSIAALVAAFEQATPGVRVNLQPAGDIQQGLIRALGSGLGLPDVCAFGQSAALAIGQRGGMLDLAGPPFDAAALQGEMVTSAWAGGRTAEGRQIGLPLSVYPGSFWYRADILQGAGLESDPERLRERLTGWEELLTLAQELKQALPEAALLADAAGDVFFTSWLQAGGAWLDGTKITIVETYVPALERAALVRRQELDADLAPGGSFWNDAMRGDRIAGLFAPSWFQGYVADIHFNQVGKWRVIRAPGGDFNQGAEYLGIPAASTKQEHAWAFVRYCCATVEGQNTLLRTVGSFPAYTPAWRDPLYDAPVGFFGEQRAYRLWADIAAAAPTPAATPHDQTMFEILQRHVRRVVDEGVDPASALGDAEADLVAAIPGLTA